MDVTIRPHVDDDREAVTELSLRAWAPVFASLEHVLRGSGVYEAQHPDWRVTQRQAVEQACAAEHVHVWVAELATAVAGFTAVRLHPLLQDGVAGPPRTPRCHLAHRRRCAR